MLEAVALALVLGQAPPISIYAVQGPAGFALSPRIPALPVSASYSNENSTHQKRSVNGLARSGYATMMTSKRRSGTRTRRGVAPTSLTGCLAECASVRSSSVLTYAIGRVPRFDLLGLDGVDLVASALTLPTTGSSNILRQNVGEM